MQCPEGYYCPSPDLDPIPCEAGRYCLPRSTTGISCPAETFSTLTKQTSSLACQPCNQCTVGYTQNITCTPTTNRVCTRCTGKPAYSSYFYTPAKSCTWICDAGYSGLTSCAPCAPGFWCSNGISNQCPKQSASLAGAKALGDCTCNPGYTTTLIGGLPVCTACVAGLVCEGGGTVQATVSDTPLANVASQVVLVQQPLPVADNLVTLVTGIPDTLAKMAALLNSSTAIYTRQVCRGTYCISCDGSAACVPRIWVGVSQGSRYSFNVSSIPADTIVYLVLTNPGFCAPVVGISAEYVTGTTVVISSISGITAMPVTCSTNAALTANLPVTGTTASLVGRRLLQFTLTVDALSVSLVVPTNQTNATRSVIQASNLTVQGYTTVDAPLSINASNTTTALKQCPVNSTSPIGATSLTQCVCLPGYRGNASAGTPCTPCNMGEFCSGGIMGLCPLKSTAPPLSNSSNDCVCDLGFFGPATNCQPCPANAYCTGGKIRNCTANSLSAPQSASPQSCICNPGLFGSNNQPCMPCSPGSWCSTGVSNPCPVNWTSNANATRVADCFCMDGFESVSTRDSSGNAINVCQPCVYGTYCKVRALPIPIYNTPHSVSQHANATPTHSSAFAPRCDPRRRLRPWSILKRHHQLLHMRR